MDEMVGQSYWGTLVLLAMQYADLDAVQYLICYSSVLSHLQYVEGWNKTEEVNKAYIQRSFLVVGALIVVADDD